MPERAAAALLRVEVRRAGPMVRQWALTFVILMALFWVIGEFTRENIIVLLVVLGPIGASSLPVLALHDRVSGITEFLTSLPVSGTALALSRVFLAMVTTFPGAVALTIALALGLQTLDIPWPGPPAGAVVVLLVAWLLLAAVSLMTLGLFVRFGGFWMTVAPLFLLVGGVWVGDLVLERMGLDPEAVFRWLVTDPWAPAALLAAVVVGGLGSGVVSYALIRDGFERFRPVRDDMLA